MRFTRNNEQRELPGGGGGLAAARIAFMALSLVVLGCSALFAARLEQFEADGKWGFREAGTGVLVVPPLFDRAAGFQDGLAPVMLVGRWGYINEVGQIALEPQYMEARPFSDGFAEVRLADGRWAVIDKAGGTLRLSSSPVLGVPSEGFVVFARDGKFGYLNEEGKEVIQPGFSGAGPFKEGLAAVSDGKWGFVNKAGRSVIKPEFDAVRDFNEGLAAFLKDGKWGFLNKSGAIAVGNNFNDAGDFSQGLAAVRINSRWGYIDKKGGIVIWPEYDEARAFSEGLAAAAFPVPAPKGEFPPVVLEWRWLDKTGKTLYKSTAAADDMRIIVSTFNTFGFARDFKPVILPVYADAAGCGNGACLVKKDGKYSFINYSGAMMEKTEFEEAAALGCGLYRVRQGLKYGLIGSTGGVLAPAVYDVLEGSGCAGSLTAALGGEAGRFDVNFGAFTAGPLEPEAPPVKFSEKCLLAEKTIADIPYQEIPGYCGAEELRAILKTSTGCFNCWLALAEIRSSTAALGVADAGAALEALGEAIKLSTDTLRLYQWRTELLLSSAPAGAHAAELIADYKQLIVMEPANPAHYRGLCAAYGLLGPALREDSSFAVHYCGKAVEMEPSAANYVNLGALKGLLEDDAGALEAFRTAVKLSPEHAPARLARARFSAEKGQDFRAVFDYSKVLETDADNTDVLEERGLVYVRMDVCAKALADLEHAGRVRPGPANLHKMAVYHWRCRKDPFKTLEISEYLLKMGEQCGGDCWRPAEYEMYLSDFYGTPEYRGLLNKYQVPPPEPR